MSVKTAVETLNPTRVKLSVEVPFDELQPSLNEAYKRIAAQVTVPGFRKGKVPSRIIDQRFGRAAVLEEAVNDAIPKLYGRAVDENDLQPLGQPDVEVTELADGVELKFTAEVDVRPEFDLPEYDGIEVTVDDILVTEEDVDVQVEALRERFGTTSVVDRAAQVGDYLTLELNATRNGEPVEDGQASGVSYKVGSATMLEGLDEAVTGLSAGESAHFRSTLLGTHEGQEVDVDVTVVAVKEQALPPLDEDFAQLASEFDTLEELRESVRERIERMKRLEQAMSARDKVLEALIASVDMPIPDGVIERQVEAHFEDGHGSDDHRSEYERDARRNFVAQLILDKVVKAEELRVSQDELTEYLIQRAGQAQMDPNQYADALVQSGGVPALVADVGRGKALAMIVDKAIVVDASGNRVNLENLREDGTYGDDDDEGESSPVIAGATPDAAGSAPDVADASADSDELATSGASARPAAKADDAD